MKFDPWSNCITLAKPTLLKKLRAFTIFLAQIFCRGMASRNFDDAHMMVSKNLLPDFVLGSGPMQSTITQLDGSSKTGIGCRGVVRIFSFGFPTI